MFIVRFLKSNIPYLIWFILYFNIAWIVLGGDTRGFIIASIIYGVSITVALSPIGETLLRFSEGCRRPATNEEKNYLIPIFEKVYENAKEIYPSLNNDIQIYIQEQMTLNAFAVGRKTVAVTLGALQTFSKEELKGVVAHELGHMAHGHTKAILLTNIGNGFFNVIVKIFATILWIFDYLSKVLAAYNILGWVLMLFSFVFRLVFNVSTFLFINAGALILSAQSRVQEYQADKFAYDTGFGTQLLKALYILQKLTMNTKLSITEKLTASHPHLALRIEEIEKMEENESVFVAE
jgi:Zn-dependent protease with chaperone function